MKTYGLYNDEPVIRTFTGKWFNPFEPNIDDICIEDIAHSLSNQCRFGGHTKDFYSVAHHSVLCCAAASESNQLAALLHDASEAYLIDIPRPIKLKLIEYKPIEDKLMKMISEKFGFEYPLCKEVKDIDEAILQYEWQRQMTGEASDELYAYSNGLSKQRFLERFNALTNGTKQA